MGNKVKRTKNEDVEKIIPLAAEYYAAAAQNWPMTWPEVVEHADMMIRQAAAGKAPDGTPMVCLHIEEGGTILAFMVALAIPMYYCPRLTVAQELMIWAHPEARGKGYGKQLLAGFEEWAAEIGAHECFVGSWENITPEAIGGLLKSNGYTLQQKMYVKDV